MLVNLETVIYIEAALYKANIGFEEQISTRTRVSRYLPE